MLRSDLDEWDGVGREVHEGGDIYIYIYIYIYIHMADSLCRIAETNTL